MGVLEKLSRKTGVIVGDDVLELFKYAQEKQFAIPAIVRFFASGRESSLDDS
jgi:fructose-bisphosphate aldolase class II